MKKDDKVRTPRFGTVTIKDILSKDEAIEQGYTEPTHYNADPFYNILGKSVDMHRMVFAGVKKEV